MIDAVMACVGLVCVNGSPRNSRDHLTDSFPGSGNCLLGSAGSRSGRFFGRVDAVEGAVALERDEKALASMVASDGPSCGLNGGCQVCPGGLAARVPLTV